MADILLNKWIENYGLTCGNYSLGVDDTWIRKSVNFRKNIEITINHDNCLLEIKSFHPERVIANLICKHK